jgi:hypothetical protein
MSGLGDFVNPGSIIQGSGVATPMGDWGDGM